MWTECATRLPRIETPVLIVHNGVIRIGELREEHPTFEEIFSPYKYWDDPEDDGKDWEWIEVTHWMPLPELPELELN